VVRDTVGAGDAFTAIASSWDYLERRPLVRDQRARQRGGGVRVLAAGSDARPIPPELRW
jgi:hypothetical protein